MALLVGDVVTNFVAKIDEVTSAVTGIQKRLDGLAKQTFSVKLGIDETKLVRAVQRIDANLGKVRRSMDQVGHAFNALTVGAAKQVVKAAATTQGAFRRTAGNSRKTLAQVAEDGKKAGGFLSIAFRNASQSFLDWSGAITLAALVSIPGFIAATAGVSRSAAENADAIDGLAAATANADLTGKAFFGNVADGGRILTDTSDITKLLDQNFAGLTATMTFVTTAMTDFFIGLQDFGTFIGGTLFDGVTALGNAFSFVGTAIQSALTPLLAFLGFGRQAVDTGKEAVSVLDVILPRLSVLGAFSLSLLGVNFILRAIVGRVRTLAATRPNTVLGRAAALINTMFIAVNNLVSPITVIANRMASILGLVSVLGSAVLSVVFGVTTLFTGIQAIFGLFAVFGPLVSNLFLRTKAIFVRLAATLGSGRARFLLFFGEIREAFGSIAKELNELRRTFGRKFNFIQFLVQSFNQIRQSVQVIAKVATVILNSLLAGGQLVASAVEDVTAITMQMAGWPGLQDKTQKSGKKQTANLQEQRIATESIAALMATIANNFWPAIINIPRNLIVGPFILLGQVAKNTFNQIRTVALGFLVKPVNTIAKSFSNLFQKVVPESFRTLGGFFKRTARTILAPFITKTGDLAKRFRTIWEPSEQAIEKQFTKASARTKELETTRATADKKRGDNAQRIAAAQEKFGAKAVEIEAKRNKVVAESAAEQKKLNTELEKEVKLEQAIAATLPADREKLKQQQAAIPALTKEVELLRQLANTKSEKVRIRLRGTLLNLTNAQTEAIKKLQATESKLEKARLRQTTLIKEAADLQKKADRAITELAKKKTLVEKEAAKLAEQQANKQDKRAAATKERLKVANAAADKAAQAQKLTKAASDSANKALESQVKKVTSLKSEFDKLGGSTKALKKLATGSLEAAQAQLEELNVAERVQKQRISLQSLDQIAAQDKATRLQKEINLVRFNAGEELNLLEFRKVRLLKNAEFLQLVSEARITQVDKEATAVEKAVDREIRALERRKTLLARQQAEAFRGQGRPRLRRGANAEFGGAVRAAFGGAQAEAAKATQQVAQTVKAGFQAAGTDVTQIVQQTAAVAVAETTKATEESTAQIRKFARNIRDVIGVAKGGGSESLLSALINGDLAAFVSGRVSPAINRIDRVSKSFFAQSKSDFDKFIIDVNALAKKANLGPQITQQFQPILTGMAQLRDSAEVSSKQIRNQLENVFNLKFQFPGAKTPAKAFQGVFVKIAETLKTEGEGAARKAAQEFLNRFALNLKTADSSAVEDAIIVALQPLADAMPASDPKNKKSPAYIGIKRGKNVPGEMGKSILLGQGDLVKSIDQLFTGVAADALPIVDKNIAKVQTGVRGAFLRIADNLKGTVGVRLANAVGGSFDAISETIGPKFTAGLKKVDSAIDKTGDRFANFIERLDAKTVLNATGRAFTFLGNKLKNLSAVVDEFGKRAFEVKGSFSDLLRGFATGQVTVAAFLGQLVLGIPLLAAFTQGLSGILLAAIALNGAFEGVGRTLFGVGNVVTGVTRSIVGIVGGLATLRIDRIADGFRGLFQTLKGLFQLITGPFQAALGVIRTFIQATRALTIVFGGMAGAAELAVKGVTKGFGRLLGGLTRLIVPKRFRERGAAIVQMVGKGMEFRGPKLFNSFAKVLGFAIKDQLPASPPVSGPLAGNFLTEAGSKMITMMSFGIIKEGGTLNRALGTVLSGAFLPIFGPASVIVSSIKGVISLIKGVGEQLTNLASNPAISALKTISDQVIDIGLTAERFAPSDEAADNFIGKFDAFARAVKPLGVEASRVETIFVTLERALSEAVAEPLGEAAAKFQRLGVDLTAFAGGEEDIIDVTLRLADQIHEGALSTEELQEAFELTAATFGPLKNLLLRGGEEIRKGMADAASVGTLLDGEAVEKAIEFNRQVEDFQFAITGIKRTIFAEIVPKFTEALARIQAWWLRNKDDVISAVQILTEILGILFDTVLKKIGQWTQDSNLFFANVGSILAFLFNTVFSFFNAVFARTSEIGGIFSRVVQTVILPLFGATATFVIDVIFPRLAAAFLRLVNEGASKLGTSFLKVIFDIQQTIIEGIAIIQGIGGGETIRDVQRKTLDQLFESRAKLAKAQKQAQALRGDSQTRIRVQEEAVARARIRIAKGLSEEQQKFAEEEITFREEKLVRFRKELEDEETLVSNITNALSDTARRITAAKVALGVEFDPTASLGLEPLADDLERASQEAADKFKKDIPAVFTSAVTSLGKEAGELGKVALKVLSDFGPEFKDLLGGLAEDLGLETEAAEIEKKLVRLQALLAQAATQSESAQQKEAIANVQRQLNAVQRSFQINEALLVDFSKKVEDLRRKAGEILGLDILDLEDFSRARQIALAELDQGIQKLKKTQADLIKQRDNLKVAGLEETTDQFIQRLGAVAQLEEAIGANEVALKGLNSQLALTKELADQSDSIRTFEKLAATFTSADTELGKLIGKEIKQQKTAIELAQNLEVLGQKLNQEIAAGIDGPVIQSLELFKDKAIEVGGEIGEELRVRFQAFRALIEAGQVEAAVDAGKQLAAALKKAADEAAAEEADTRFDTLAESLGTAVRESLSKAMTEFNENEGKVKVTALFNTLFKSISEALVNNLITDLQKNLVSSLKEGFKDVFSFAGEQAGILATAATAAVAIALQFLTAQSKQEIAVAKEGLQSVVEETERVRGIISGDSTVKLAAVAENLREAMVPTNNWLKMIEFNTRVGLASSPATPLAQAVGGS